MFVLFPDLYLLSKGGWKYTLCTQDYGHFLSKLSLVFLDLSILLFLRNSTSELIYKLDKNVYVSSQTWGWQVLIASLLFPLSQNANMTQMEVDMWLACSQHSYYMHRTCKTVH